MAIIFGSNHKTNTFGKVGFLRFLVWYFGYPNVRKTPVATFGELECILLQAYTCLTGHYGNVFFDPQTLHGEDTKITTLRQKKDRLSVRQRRPSWTPRWILGYLFTRLQSNWSEWIPRPPPKKKKKKKHGVDTKMTTLRRKIWPIYSTSKATVAILDAIFRITHFRK